MFESLKKLSVKVGLADFEEEGAVTATPNQVVSALPIPAAIPSPASKSVVPSVSTEQAKVIAEGARQELHTALANCGAKIFQEFNDMLSTFEEDIPDESARYKSVIKHFVKRGAPVLALIGDLDTCIGAIGTKAREFGEETKRQLAAKVGARQDQLSAIDQQIEAKQQQLVDIQNEIAGLRTKKQEETVAVDQARPQIQSVQDGFTSVYQDTLANLQAIKGKITEYGKGL